MEITNIYDSWGSIVNVTYEEFLEYDKSFWSSMVINRNLIVIRGIDKKLSDSELYDLSKKFGTVWDSDTFSKPYIDRGSDSTLITLNENKPISYFKSNNNAFSGKFMAYHADMPHVKEYSYPGRVLYMVENTVDGSGMTSWLNLELGWQQCTDEEKQLYDDYEIIMHDMYRAGSRMEKFSFLKINPKTGKISPRVNNYWIDNQPGIKTWIHHLIKNDVHLSYEESGKIVESVYRLMESKPNTIYDHVWKTDDIVVFDNWFNVHKRTKVNDVGTNGGRLLKRTTFNFY